MSVKTYDELRASPPGTVCEHGARERSCPHCESNAADQEVERIEARLEQVERERDELARKVAELEAENVRVSEAANAQDDRIDMMQARVAELERVSRAVDVAMYELDGSCGWQSPQHIENAAKTATRKRQELESRVAELEAALEQATGLPSPDYATARSDAEGDMCCEDALARVRELESEEPKWVVNNIGELGVTIHGRAFFLYKGYGLEYGIQPSEETGKVMQMRPVGKREFGEVCHPLSWWPLSEASKRMQSNYPDSIYEIGDGWADVPPTPSERKGTGE